MYCLPVQVQKRILAPNPTMSVGSDGSGIKAMAALLWEELRACIASNYPVAQWPLEVVEFILLVKAFNIRWWSAKRRDDGLPTPSKKGGKHDFSVVVHCRLK